MPRLAQAPVAGDIAADPRSIRTAGVLLPSRSPRGPWIACTNSENRSGLARWADLDPEVSIQTSHAYQEDRPLCPTCLHLTSIASAVAGPVCPARLQRLLPRSIEGRGERPDGTGLLARRGRRTIAALSRRMTATLTATATTNGQRQRPVTTHNTRRI